MQTEQRAHARAPRFPGQGLEKEVQGALRVYRPAPAARVETRNGYPVQIVFSGFRGRVIAASGPWRSSGDWWTEDSYAKDEWDLEIQSNSKTKGGKQQGVYRVCYDCAKKEWYVWGTFD
jgi:protein ImuB